MIRGSWNKCLVFWGGTLASNPEDDFLQYEPAPEGAYRELGIGALQGATTDLGGGIVDIGALTTGLASKVDPRLLAMSPTASALAAADPAMQGVAAEYGSEALGSRFFPAVPEGLEGYRDLGRLGGGLTGAGEAITARGSRALLGGIQDFMQYLPNVRPQAVTPDGQIIPLPDDALPDTSVTEMLAGRNSTTGPAREKMAKELRKMGKSEDEIFRATQAYFDTEVLGMDTDAFRHEIPNTDKSTLKLGQTDSDVSGFGSDYLYSKDRVSFGFKPDVMRYEYDPAAEDLFLNDMPEAAKFKSGQQDFGRAPTLGEILEFPELFEEYPQLKDVYVVGLEAPSVKVGGETRNLGGFYLHDGVRGKPTIAMSRSTSAKDFQSSLLHEVQHAVQAVENTPSGSEFMSIYNELKDRLEIEGDSEYVMERALNLYEALYGEVEARAVQRRFLNPESKKEVPIKDLRKEAPADDTIVSEYDVADIGEEAIREELEYGDVSYKDVYPEQFKADGGVITMTDVARSTGRGPKGVASLAPKARNMFRPMVS